MSSHPFSVEWRNSGALVPYADAVAFMEARVAAIGVRVRRWVTFHGIALNVAPDLTHFSGIVPCGISASYFGVTSLRDLGLKVSMSEVDQALRETFEPIFGKIEEYKRLRSKVL